MDKEEREAAILELMPLVHRIARGVARKVPRAEYQDLVSEGVIGAIQAVDRWNPDADNTATLPTYASRRIKGQMYDWLREEGPLSRDDWKAVVEGEKEFYLDSLDVPVDGEEGSASLVDMLPDNEDTIARMLDILAMREVIRLLPAKERELLVQYYYEGATLKEIGVRYGVTESRICQRMAKAHEKAYRFLEQEPVAA